MLAGAITFSTVVVILNSKEPIVVSIDSFSDFKLTGSNNSTRYNSFSFVLNNQGKRDIGLRSSDVEIYNGTISSANLLSNWTIGRDYLLSSLQSYYITVTSTSNSPTDWLQFNSTITLKLTVYATDQSYNKADKLTISAPVTIGSSYVSSGPLKLLDNQTISGSNNYAALDSTSKTNNSLEIVVLNYGNLPVNYTLDFIVSNSSLAITTKYIGTNTNLTSTIDGYLPAANGLNPSSSAGITPNKTIVLTVTALSPPSANSNYYVIVWLKIESTIEDTLMIVC